LKTSRLIVKSIKNRILKDTTQCLIYQNIIAVSK